MRQASLAKRHSSRDRGKKKEGNWREPKQVFSEFFRKGKSSPVIITLRIKKKKKKKKERGNFFFFLNLFCE